MAHAIRELSHGGGGGVGNPGNSPPALPPWAPPPPPLSDNQFTVLSGECEVAGDCVTSPGFPADYGNNERCVILPSTPYRPLAVRTFQTHSAADGLTVNGVYYFSGEALTGVIATGAPPLTRRRVCAGLPTPLAPPPLRSPRSTPQAR